jgi:hypothetical protein
MNNTNAQMKNAVKCLPSPPPAEASKEDASAKESLFEDLSTNWNQIRMMILSLILPTTLTQRWQATQPRRTSADQQHYIL